MTRLQFLRSLGQLGLAAACVPVLAACKADDDDGGPTPDANNNMNNPDASMGNPADAGIDGPPPTCATLSTAIAVNHGHTMTVSPADVAAGVEQTYLIQGTSLHPHTVVITAANFATLKMTGTVTVMSSLDDAHRHNVTVTCTS